MTSEPLEADDAYEPDQGPVFRVLPRAADIPALCERMLAHLRDEGEDGDFTFEGVEFEIVQGLWLSGLGLYEPEEDTPSTPEEIAAGASPTGPFGRVMVEWDAETRDAFRAAWGEPVVHTPRLVGAEQEPEGIVDYLLVAQDFPQAELWDHGELFVALLSDWAGEPGESMFRQFLMVLPREYVMNGFQPFMGGDATEHALFMHGEHPLELRRRAWILSTAFGQGDVRLRDVPVEASRYSLQSRTGTTTVWTFAEDGRALLLILDPECEFAQSGAQQFAADSGADGDSLADAQLILIERLLDGIPDDLRACIAARGETARGDVSEHALEFGLLDGRPVPIISGAFWFDGEIWHATRGLMEVGHQNGFGMDDFGVESALRVPYRLGGAFTADVLADEQSEHRQGAEQLFEACPFPEQPRPEGVIRLGYAIPTDVTRGEIVDDIERVTAAWWDREPDQAKLGDDTFRMGGRGVGGDSSTLTAIIGRSERWTLDALQEWTDTLVTVMSERWGAPREVHAEDTRTGIDRRTSLTRVMRGTGLRRGPLWWVNGHAVALLAGVPDTSYSTKPEVLLTISRADAVIEMLGSLYLQDVRWRARVIKEAAAIAAAQQSDRRALDSTPEIAWDGPALAGTDRVPRATRGGLRAGGYFWAWHFTHDGRGLLTSHEFGQGATRGTFEERVALFQGLPDDLLSLVADRDPDGLYPVVTREGEAEGESRLDRARTLPDAKAVFFHDGLDWRAPEGMLRWAHAAAVAEADADLREDAPDSDALTADPLRFLYSNDVGVPQLQWVLRVPRSLTPESIAGDYGRHVFSRPISVDEAEEAFARPGTALEAALTGTLNGLLDVIAERPGYRNVLDAALSNPDPERRREIVLWLLEQKLDASTQLSFLTPIGVLLENSALDAGDAVLLRRLLESGAEAGPGLLGAAGRHPIVQLWERDADQAELLPLLDALLDTSGDEDPRGDEGPRYDLAAAVSPDGTSLRDRLRAGFGHGRPRDALLARLEDARAGGASP